MGSVDWNGNQLASVVEEEDHILQYTESRKRTTLKRTFQSIAHKRELCLCFCLRREIYMKPPLAWSVGNYVQSRQAIVICC
jgi:hypothetical protein